MEEAKIVYIDENGENRELLEKKIKNLYFLNINDNLCEKIKKIDPYIVIAKDEAIEKIDSCDFDEGWYIYIYPPKNINPKKALLVLAKSDELDYFQNIKNCYAYAIKSEDFIKDILEVLKNFKYYTLEKPFREFFTKDELIDIVIPKTAVKGSCAFVVNTQNYMFEVDCYDESVTIWDLDNGGKLNKEEFLEKIRDDEFKPMHCLRVDL